MAKSSLSLLLLLSEKRLVCFACILASAAATAPLHYHLFSVTHFHHPSFSDFAVRLFGDEGHFRRNLLAACHKRLARGFIHKDAFYGVLLAGDQVLVGYGILDGNTAFGL